MEFLDKLAIFLENINFFYKYQDIFSLAHLSGYVLHVSVLPKSFLNTYCKYVFLLCRSEGDYDSTKEDWMSGVGDHYAAIATHDFKGRDSHELTFSKGHTLRVAPKNLQPPNVAPGWLLAVNSTDGGRPDSFA